MAPLRSSHASSSFAPPNRNLISKALIALNHAPLPVRRRHPNLNESPFYDRLGAALARLVAHQLISAQARAIRCARALTVDEVSIWGSSMILAHQLGATHARAFCCGAPVTC
eukprot:5677034-Pleurochrysis_carterae.AAC.1